MGIGSLSRLAGVRMSISRTTGLLGRGQFTYYNIDTLGASLGILCLMIVSPVDAHAQSIPIMEEECLCLGRVERACEAAAHQNLAKVFAGTVTKIDHRAMSGLVKVDFRLETVLWEGTEASATVFFHPVRCSPFSVPNPFELGHKYVVYASRKLGVNGLYVSACSRVVPFENSRTDIDYWNERESAAQSASVFGTAKKYLRMNTGYPLHTIDEEKIYEIEPLLDHEIVIDGIGGRYLVKTDSTGKFQIRNVEPGRYVVSTSSPLHPEERARVSIAVSARTCASVDFRESPEGRMSVIGIGARRNDQLAKLSRLVRNVPILNSLEMSPFWVPIRKV